MKQTFRIIAVSSALISCVSALGLMCAALSLNGGGLAAVQGNLFSILSAGLASVCLGAFAAWLLLRQFPGKALDALEQAMRFLTQNNCKCRFDPLDDFSSLQTLSKALEGLRSRCKDNYEHFYGLLNGIHLPFLLVDREERVLFTNERLLAMVEIEGDKKKQYGRTLAEVFYNDPGRKTLVGRAMNARESFLQEVDIHGHKGKLTHVMSSVNYLADSEGKVLGGLCLYQDMTEIRKHEAQIRANNEKFAKAAEHSEEIVGKLNLTTRRLEQEIALVTERANAQQKRTSDSSSAMMQMSGSLEQVAANADSAAQQAASASERVEEGARVLEESVRTIQHAHGLADSLRKNMGNLGQKAEDIGQVLHVITDIADQTNLLALNAAIEAARAGGAGRGFAVVADEVRKLAEKTMVATKEIETAIKGMQDSTRDNVRNTEIASDAIRRGTDLVERSGAILQEAVRFVTTTADAVHAIVAATEEQTQAICHATRSTTEIHEMAVEVFQSMQHSVEVMRDVEGITENLRKLMVDMRN